MNKLPVMLQMLTLSCILQGYRQPYIPILGTARLGSEKLTFERLCEGENPNMQDEFGNTPVHYAVFIESKEVTNLLLAHHARPNIQNNKGKTALHIAVQRGNDYLARRLLKYGADPNIQDKTGDTPLHIAARRTDRKHAVRLVQDLLCYHADKTIKNREGEIPLQLAQPLRLRPVTVHATYRQEKQHNTILALLQSDRRYTPYVPRVKRPVRMYA